MDIKMYDVALRSKMRFDSPKGPLNLEALWDVPLRSRGDFNLDTIAKMAHRDVRDVGEESFVYTRRTNRQVKAELKLDIVKHVIAVLLAEEELAKQRADRSKEKEKLLAVMERKQDAALEGLSEEDLQKRLNELQD